jgi:hypothetical protein
MPKARSRAKAPTETTTWRVIGACGVCRGPVCAAVSFRGAPPMPICTNCGRTPAAPWGAFIEMQKEGT